MSVVLYLLALLGLGTSTMLLVDYTSAGSSICTGGCDVVRASKYADIFGIKTPFFGVVFFAVALALILWPSRRLLVAWATAGALSAVAFVGIQLFALHAICPYCCIADGSALLLFIFALISARQSVTRPRIAILAGVGVVAAAAAFLPFVIPHGKALSIAPGAPKVIVAEQRPGVATIVEFVDFECPYCRRLHGTLGEVLKDYGDKVRLVRKQHPLTSMHPHALVAAQAACCAEEVGAGEPMANALMTADPDELTPAGCEQIAAKVGADVDKYKACMASGRPEQRLARDNADAKAAGVGEVAPIFWVGNEQFRGAKSADVIRAAIDRDLARQ